MKNYSVRSPTRVDLAGGTLDLWPLYLFVDSAVTVNVAIDIWTSVEVTDTGGDEVCIESVDFGERWKFATIKQFVDSSDEKLSLFRRVISYVNPRSGFHLKAASQSPVGGGLGGSSSLVISLLKVFQQRGDLRPLEPIALAHLAHNIEAQVLNTPTGTQDYFPAISGGLNFIEYHIDRIVHEPTAIRGSDLEKNFMLVYTGQPHHSGLNNFQVLDRAIRKDQTTLQALREIRDIAIDMAKVGRSRDWAKIPDLFLREYEARIKLAPSFSSLEIEKLKKVSLSAGASALKICGAGGGGCVLLWVPSSHREKVQTECEKQGFRVLSAKPVDLLG